MAFLEFFREFLWGAPTIGALIFTGLVLSFKTRFFYITKMGHWLKRTIGNLESEGGGGSVSPFSALCTALGASVGVGNIAGVASAIMIGGAGAVFWMLVAALFGLVISYGENVLGFLYRRNECGALSGGPMYYLCDGVGGKCGKILSVAFSLFCVAASFGIGNISQIKAITVNMQSALPIPALQNCRIFNTDLYSLLLGALLALSLGAVLLGGIKRISSIAEALVPVMVVGYILGVLYICFCNIERVPAAVGAVFKGAFTPQSAAGGMGGFLLSRAVKSGFTRGIFSHEAGMGSSVIINSVCSEREAAVVGMWGMLQVFIDTVVVCSLTALSILSSPLFDLKSGAVSVNCTDAALVGRVFFREMGAKGSVFIALSVLLFAFASAVGWSYYGLKCWEYIFLGKGKWYKLLFITAAFLGANIEINLVWTLSDIFNALMILPNVAGVLILSPQVAAITKEYNKRL